MNRRITLMGFALALFAFAAAPAVRAQVPVFGNLTANPAGTSGGSFIDANFIKSVRFTTGTLPVSVASALVSVRSDTTATTTVSFGLWSNTVSGDPGSLLFSMGNQSFVNVTVPQNVLFSPGSSFILLPNTAYHLRFTFIGFESSLLWSSVLPARSPFAQNGSGITYQTYRISGDAGASYIDSTNTNLFQLNGSIVPEAGSVVLMLSGMLTLGAGLARRRKA